MSIADDDAAPSPAPSAGASPTPAPVALGSGPGGFPIGGVPPTGPGLVAPVYPARDPTDPLGPERLREAEMSVQQSIALYNRLLRVARNPGGEPGYHQVIAALVRYQALYRDLNSTAEVTYDRAVRVRDLIMQLDMTRLENIKAYADAAQAADTALNTWKQVHSTYLAVFQCLHRSGDPVAAVTPSPRRLSDLHG